MTRSIITTTAAFAFAIATMGSAQAAPITTLEQCYNAVITWCTNTYPDHADSCGQSSALDECDEEFGNASAAVPGRTILHRAGFQISPRAFQRLMAGAPVRRANR